MGTLYVKVNGIKICYEERGEGFPVLLIHGFTGNKEGWVGQYIPLSEHFRVIRFDNRNGGCSDRPNIPNTLDMLADDIKGLMDYLKLDKAHIIGWSMGGIIVQKFAIKYPEYITKIVLINTVKGAPNNQAVDLLVNNSINELELRNKNKEEAFWTSARLGYHIKFRKEMEANPNKKFYGLWSVQDLIEIQNINPITPQDIINQSNALYPPLSSDDLKKIKNKTLLIASSHDRLTTKNALIELQKIIPKSELVIIKRAGHSSPISRAPEVNKIIIDFLKR
ncbi:MAG: alpha/beta hydrolase [Promethearchaeota archaeon]|nr:MAG: alpha/beta hydrolase [Candidatus Lokiarchaeota archaeon]